ncbi:MAG: hypothetical protein ACI81W_001535 [Saprospiraceae bacterium]|jgi:hypothetical protein
MYKKFLMACLLLMSLFACKKDNQTNVIVNIADDFYVDMFEDISNGDQRFQLNISTISTQSCLNYLIDYDVTIDKESHAIELIINDLIEPATCEVGVSITEITIPLGFLPNGYYSFNLNLKNAVFNKGRLGVFQDQYLLDMNSDDGIDIVNAILYRIPKNTLWGYVAYENNSSATAGENFVSSLENLPTVNNIENNNLYPFGYYGYFKLKEDSKIDLSEEINANHHIPFFFQNDSDDVSTIRTLVEDACGNSNLAIHIFTESGLEIKCE